MTNARSESQLKTILLIDDEPALLLGLSTIVRQAGYHAITANNGAEGFRLVQLYHPTLIICDVQMPSVNGFELRELLSHNPKTSTIPFIFLTSRSGLSDKLKGLESGADDYIIKPFKRQELLARIKSILRRTELRIEQGRSEVKSEIEQLRQEVTGRISQELQTPALLVLQSLDMLLSSRFQDDAKSQQQFIQTALRNAEYLQTISDDLSTLSQIDQGVVSRLRYPLSLEKDFYPLVEKSQTRWQSKKLNWYVTLDPTIVLHASPNGFRQAVSHLLDNAGKFSVQNGDISIFLENKQRGGSVLTISNEGARIPLELREKVFERFFQISPGLHEGLGLGLTIARAFARALGGDVLILDTKAGCEVQLTIPPLPD